jgi:hypothetical protein
LALLAAAFVVALLLVHFFVPVENSATTPRNTTPTMDASDQLAEGWTGEAISIDVSRYDQLREKTIDWQRSRGHEDVAARHPAYANYSDNTLKKLAVDGDRLASSILASRNRMSAPLIAIEWYLSASILGSTAATLAIAEIYERLATQAEGPSTGTTLKDEYPALDVRNATAMTEALAWAYVTEMRGDPAGSLLRDRLLGSYPISATQRSGACATAKLRYDAIVLARTAKVLPVLDDSPPPISADPFQPGLGCEDWPLVRPFCTALLVGRATDSVVKVASAYKCENPKKATGKRPVSQGSL